MNINVRHITMSGISIFLGIMSFIHMAYAELPTSLVMATFHQPKSYEGQLSGMIFQEAFRRLGIELVIKIYPVPRATIEAEEGNVAGELTRLYEYQARVQNLIRVEEPLYKTRVAGYALKSDIQLNGWDSLKGAQFCIDHRRGLKHVKKRLSELVSKEFVGSLATPEQGLKRLINERCELYIDIAFKVQNLLTAPQFRSAGIRNVGTLNTSTVHGYIHKAYKQLVPKLEAIIKQMKEERLIEHYQSMILRQN